MDKHYIRKLQAKIREIAKEQPDKRHRWVMEWHLADKLDSLMRLMDAVTADIAGDAWRMIDRIGETERMLNTLGLFPEDFETEIWMPVYEPLYAELLDKYLKLLHEKSMNEKTWII